MKNLIVAMASLAFIPAASFAAAPTLSEVLDASGITLSGHASASYAYSTNRVVQPDLALFEYYAAGAPGAFTGQSNSFTFNQAELYLAKLPAEGFGGAVDVFAGQDAGKLNRFGNSSDFNLHQAYVQYAAGGLTVKGGKFAALAGAETVSDANNSNVTRSLLFSIQPLTLTGARVGYRFNDMVAVYAGLSNSAMGYTQDNNDQKTIETAIALTPAKDVNIRLTNYMGNEGDAGDKFRLFDLNINYALGDLSLGLNGDVARLHDENAYGAPGASWTTRNSGAAVYANYQVTKAFRTGLRAEYLRTKYTEASGYYINRNQKEVTLTGDYAFAKNFNVLAEVRYDKGDYDDDISVVEGFVSNDGTLKDNNTTLIVKAIYKF